MTHTRIPDGLTSFRSACDKFSPASSQKLCRAKATYPISCLFAFQPVMRANCILVKIQAIIFISTCSVSSWQQPVNFSVAGNVCVCVYNFLCSASNMNVGGTIGVN